MELVWPTSFVGVLHPSGNAKARARVEDFLTLARAARADLTYKEAKLGLGRSQAMAETKKSLFEELGLLFVPYRSNKVVLTPLGSQLTELLDGQDLESLPADIAKQATALLVWALSRCQINRPQSRGVPNLPREVWSGCNVRPYAAAWLAIDKLGGALSLPEFMGALRFILKVDEFPAALEKIRDARAAGILLADRAAWANRGPSMNYAIYWRSHLSIAEQLLEWDSTSEVLTAVPAAWDIARAAIRFQSGCDGNLQDAITGKDWADAEDYFVNIVGSACPAFLATGAPTVKDFEGQTLADLGSYEVAIEAASFIITGGSELCALPVKLQCYHPNSPARLLRIDNKIQLPSGGVRLQLGLGIPITSLPLIEKALGY